MSSPRRTVVLSSDARADLADLLGYTERRWGIEQRRAYRRRVFDALRTLAEFPDLAKRAPELGKDTRIFRVGQHVVVFELAEDRLVVVGFRHIRRVEGFGVQDDIP